MISYVYSARREQVPFSEFKSVFEQYCTILDAVDNTTLMRAIAAGVVTKTSYTEALDTIRASLWETCRQGVVIKEGVSRTTYFDVITQMISNKGATLTYTSQQTALRYMAYYVWWIYKSAEEILDCIINNGTVSELEFVGPKTKKYLADIKVDKVKKRFGSPNDISAEPLIFQHPYVNLFGPPMTTKTYSKTQITEVYNMLGCNEIIYAPCGRTTLARPAVSVTHVGMLNIWGELAVKFENPVSEAAIKRDFFYDFFLYKMTRLLADLEFNLDTLKVDFEALRDGGVIPKYLTNVKLNNVNSIPFLIGLVY